MFRIFDRKVITNSVHPEMSGKLTDDCFGVVDVRVVVNAVIVLKVILTHSRKERNKKVVFSVWRSSRPVFRTL